MNTKLTELDNNNYFFIQPDIYYPTEAVSLPQADIFRALNKIKRQIVSINKIETYRDARETRIKEQRIIFAKLLAQIDTPHLNLLNLDCSLASCGTIIVPPMTIDNIDVKNTQLIVTLSTGKQLSIELFDNVHTKKRIEVDNFRIVYENN